MFAPGASDDPQQPSARNISFWWRSRRNHRQWQLEVFQRGDFLRAELRPEKKSWNTTIRGRRDPADPLAFSGLAVAGPLKTAIPVLVHARAEPLNTSSRLLRGHRCRRSQFDNTRSQGLCRWSVPGLRICAARYHQITARAVSESNWQPGSKERNLAFVAGSALFVFAGPRGARPDRTRQRWSPKCVAVGTGSLRRPAKVHQQCSVEAPQNRARKAQERFAGAGRYSAYPGDNDGSTGPLLRRKVNPTQNRCCSRTSMSGCSPLPSARRCRTRLPGSPLRFLV